MVHDLQLIPHINKVSANSLHVCRTSHNGAIKILRVYLIGLDGQLWQDHCAGDNQLHAKFPAFKKNAADLLKVPVGQVSLGAVEHNIAVATLFIEAWLRGRCAYAVYSS